jgi:hypothetical protein
LLGTTPSAHGDDAAAFTDLIRERTQQRDATVKRLGIKTDRVRTAAYNRGPLGE